MTNKLYVGNVPLDATEEALRRHFAACGGVADVEILHERQSGKSRGLAFVTMTSPSFAAAALTRLNGVPFDGSVLRVSDAPLKADRSEAKPKVKIVLQFRERTSMAYDLDCEGLGLTLRVSLGPEEDFHVEARSKEGTEAVVGIGNASSRREALAQAVQAWNAASTATLGRTVDADAVADAMLNVRAI